MADTSKTTLKQLKYAMNKAKDYTDNEIAGITGVSKVEPEELDMPKVFFYGTALPTTKDNVNLTMDYISNTAKFSSFVKLKCQGNSSMGYAKKNFTVVMYSDEARATKLKKDFKGWGAQSKFCLKANYVDTTHTRNISGARIAYDMVASRPDSPFKQQLLQCPRNGAVDGFPIKLYFNGEFYGIYTWNIPKDGWMFNMDKNNLNHVVLCAERNTDGNASAINSCQFRQLWTNGDGQDWSVEVGTMSEDLRTKFNRVIAFVMNATDQEFHDNIGDYFDLYSLLDYYCFTYLTCHLDGLAKNMLMVTYDGTIWGACLYDMDSIYGVSWNGNSYVASNYQCPEQYQEQFSLLWQRIERCFGTELYARYLELRQGALSLSNIIKHVEEIYDVIPDRVLADEKAKWTSLPQVGTNTMTRFRNYMRDRAVYVDAQMQEIGTPQSSVECTGITLDKDTLTLGIVEGGTTDDSNKNYLENVTWELGTLNGDITQYSLADSTADYRCQLTDLPVGTYTLHHDTYTYKKLGLNDNGIIIVGTSAKGAPNSSDITFNITNPNTTVDISVFPNGVTPITGVTLTRADISDIQEYSIEYTAVGSPSWAGSVDNNYLVIEFIVGSTTDVDKNKLANICIGDDKYYISNPFITDTKLITTLSDKSYSSEYQNNVYVSIALPKSKYGNTLDEFKTYCSNNGISNIYFNKDIQGTGAVDSTTSDLGTNLLDGAEWLNGTVNENDGTINSNGGDKYTTINISTPGRYALSSTIGYTYRKIVVYNTDGTFIYGVVSASPTNDIYINIPKPSIIKISAYPNNLDWDSTALSFIGANLNNSITNKDVTYTLTASDINVRYIGSQYVFTELFLNKVYNDITIVKYDGNNYITIPNSGMGANDTNLNKITNMNNLGYAYYGTWGEKTLLSVALPIAYGTTADEILANMTSTTITINSSDELAKLETPSTSERLSAQLTATVTPENCTQPVVWSVSPTGIATVDNGLVTAVANGEATVTATCGTQTATCAVTVSGMSESGGDNGDYTDISYIESTGTQYINTRIVPTTSTKIELVAEMSASRQYDHIFGSDNFMKVQWMNEFGTAIYVTKKNGQNQVSELTLGKHTYVMDMADTTNAITIDGTNYGNTIGQVESTTYPLLLLCGYNNGTIETEFCGIGKIYSCKIYYEDTLVANMKPVLTNSGTYGLLDTVNNTFYASEVGSFTGGGTPSGGDTDPTNANLVFQVNSTSMNTVDNTLTDNIAGISATLTGNPTVSGNQIAFTASDTFSFDINSLNLTSSNRTFRIKFTPTTLDNNIRNVIGVGSSNGSWNSLTTSYVNSTVLRLQHGDYDFINCTAGFKDHSYTGSRLPANPVTDKEYEIVISENIDGNVRWFVDGTLVQNGTTTCYDPLYISNTEGNVRFIGNYSLIEIYNGYCDDYTEFTNMVNN